MTFPEAIRQVRADHDMTQKELSTALDHGQSWCSKVEAGVREPTIRDIETLSMMFGLQLVRTGWAVQAPRKAKSMQVTHA